MEINLKTKLNWKKETFRNLNKSIDEDNPLELNPFQFPGDRQRVPPDFGATKGHSFSWESCNDSKGVHKKRDSG